MPIALRCAASPCVRIGQSRAHSTLVVSMRTLASASLAAGLPMVFAHVALMMKAEDVVQVQAGIQLAVSTAWTGRCFGEVGVVARQEVFEHTGGLRQIARTGLARLAAELVLESAPSAFDPTLGLRRALHNRLDPKFLNGSPRLCRQPTNGDRCVARFRAGPDRSPMARQPSPPGSRTSAGTRRCPRVPKACQSRIPDVFQVGQIIRAKSRRPRRARYFASRRTCPAPSPRPAVVFPA